MQLTRSCDDAPDVLVPLATQLAMLRASFDPQKARLQQLFDQCLAQKVDFMAATAQLITIKGALKGIAKQLWAPSGVQKQAAASDMIDRVDCFGRELVDSLQNAKFLKSWCSTPRVRAHVLVAPVDEDLEYERDYLVPPPGLLAGALAWVPSLKFWGDGKVPQEVALEDKVKSEVEYYLKLLQAELHLPAAWERDLVRETNTLNGLYLLFHRKYQEMAELADSAKKESLKAYFDGVAFVFAQVRARLNFLSTSTLAAKEAIKVRKAAEAHFKTSYESPLRQLEGLYRAYKPVIKTRGKKPVDAYVEALRLLVDDLFAQLAPAQLALTKDEARVSQRLLNGDRETMVVSYAIKCMLPATSGFDVELELVSKMVPTLEAEFAKSEEFKEIFRKYRERTAVHASELSQLDGIAEAALRLLKSPSGLSEYAQLVAKLDPVETVVFDTLQFIARRKKFTPLTSCDILLRSLSRDMNPADFNAKVLHLVSIGSDKELQDFFEDSSYEDRLQALPEDLQQLLYAWSATGQLAYQKAAGLRESRFILEEFIEPFCTKATIDSSLLEIPLLVGLAEVREWDAAMRRCWGEKEFSAFREDARAFGRFLGKAAPAPRPAHLTATVPELEGGYKLGKSEDPVWAKVITRQESSDDEIRRYLETHVATKEYDIELDLFLYRIRYDERLYQTFKRLISSSVAEFRHTRSDYLLGEASKIAATIVEASSVVSIAKAIQHTVEFARMANVGDNVRESHTTLSRFLYAKLEAQGCALGIKIEGNDLLHLAACARFALDSEEKEQANERLHTHLKDEKPPIALIPLIVDNAMDRAFDRKPLSDCERDCFVAHMLQLYAKERLLPSELRGFHALYAIFSVEKTARKQPIRDAIISEIGNAKFFSSLSNYDKLDAKK